LGKDALVLGRMRSALCSLMVVIAACGGDPQPATCTSGPSPVTAAPGASPSAAGTGASPLDLAATITFRRNGAEVRKLSLGAMKDALKTETIRAYDPYYNREKTFHAFSVARVLEKGFEGQDARIGEIELVLRAKDGYTVAMRGSRILEDGGFIAYEDVEVPGWEPIGPQKANPAPFYFIWSKKGQASLETHPRPWQLAAIEIVRFQDAFPKTVPADLAKDDPAWNGFAIYRDQCVHCHAINRQGGRVGPELNVPKSIVEYRPEAQIKAYIKNPLDFRYSAMPPHPSMTDANLDEIVAYLRAMSTRKHDDEAKPPAPPSSVAGSEPAPGSAKAPGKGASAP
jgi:mono/diheme cytochrome c family protein